MASATERWRVTPAHLRAVLGGALLCCTAIVAQRADLLVVAAPLVVVGLWAGSQRPNEPLSVDHRLGNMMVHEGIATTLTVAVAHGGDHVDDIAADVSAPASVDVQPRAAELAPDGDGASPSLTVAVRPDRWGRYTIPPPLVVASTVWNGYRFATQRRPTPLGLIALPRPTHFEAIAAPVHAPGLVGTNRSPRPGAGTDLALVRPFQPGDRLRRIHWVESLRTGELHVTTTWAEHDRHVALVVDAFEDLGVSHGVGGRASSLDVSVRACAAIAEHYIHSGDRVGVSVIGARGLRQVRPASGRGQLRRILMTLAGVVPADAVTDDGRLVPGLTTDALVLVLSPLTSPGGRERVARIANRGVDVIAIDCLPPDIVDQPGDPFAELAWRIERLDRERHLRRMRTAGVPVVAWTGVGSLDHVLLARQQHR